MGIIGPQTLKIPLGRRLVVDSHVRTGEIVKHDVIMNSLPSFVNTRKFRGGQQFPLDRFMKRFDFTDGFGMLLPC